MLIAAACTFLAIFLSGGPGSASWWQWLIVQVGGRGDLGWLVRPWSWLTYPLVTVDFIRLLFGCLWFYWCGGTLERAWGSRNFAVLLAAFTVISVFGLAIGSFLFDTPATLAGFLLPTASLIVAWAAMDPDEEIRFYGIFPVKLKFLALIDVLIVYFSYGMGQPLFGFFALLGPLAAYLYVRKMPRLNLSLDLPFRSRRQPARQPYLRMPEEDRERVSGFDPLRKRREQEEIARLRRLLGEDDDDRPTARR